ncbi:MAG: hypothetical protein QNK03_02955 [Myxococcota bacterium]|nr:hypothetical protein [Myxococcota bacterium]
MRSISRWAPMALLALLCVGGGRVAAEPVAFEGSLDLELPTVAPPLSVQGFGVAVPNPEAGTLSIPAGQITGQTAIAVTDPAVFPIEGLRLTVLQESGHFSVQGSSVRGTMPAGALAKVCLFAACFDDPPAIVSVPMSHVGVGGTETVSVLVNVTVVGAPWTTGSTTVGGIARQGFAHGLASATTSAVSNPGELQLVTPIFISTNIGAQPIFPGFGIFSMRAGDSDACRDGVDNDEDGLVDFPEDPGCVSEADPSETDDRLPCDDRRDNDGDGVVDLEDPGCDAPGDPSENSPELPCDNGIDDDGDQLSDVREDPGCAAADDPSERSPALVCDNGVDDDGDFGADFPADRGCDAPTDASERSDRFVCDDGVDNDGDGRSDFPADSDCESPLDGDEYADRDGDRIRDRDDNCTDVANRFQRDTNGDGYGNACDPDYDGDGVVGLRDFAVLRAQFGREDDDPLFDPDVDADGDGAIGLADFNAFRLRFGEPPGPSGPAGARP